MHLDSFGFKWNHLDSLVSLDLLWFTWIYLDSLGFTWIHLDLLGLTWTHLDSLGFIWTHLDSLGFTWTHFDSLRLTWTHLVSLWIHFDLPWTLDPPTLTREKGITQSHKGKGKTSRSKKGKGKGETPYNFTPDSPVHPNTARRTHARNETISRFGGASLKADSLPPISDIPSSSLILVVLQVFLTIMFWYFFLAGQFPNRI